MSWAADRNRAAWPPAPALAGWFVLVAGWPAAGKSTLARALATELGLPLLAKDEIKEALMDGLGYPATVAQSRRLGRAAVVAMLRVAQRCPGAVLDSTWFEYADPLVRQLPGRCAEVICTVPVELDVPGLVATRTRLLGTETGT